jgi:hypothetical protein
VQLVRPHTSKRNLLPAALPPGLRIARAHLKEIVLEQGTSCRSRASTSIRSISARWDHLLLAVMRQGEAIETATIGYEGAVGSFAGLGARRSHTRAVVQVSGAALRISASHFRKAAEDSEAVRHLIIRYGEMLLIQVQRTAACNALHAVEARLSRWLLQARDRVESNTVKLTHEFLSQMLGVRRTTVTVVANVLQQAASSATTGGTEIVDRIGLGREHANATRPSAGRSMRSGRSPPH